MKKISFWARKHYIAARVLIVVIKILLIVIAIYAGINLRVLGISFSPILFYLSAIALMLSVFYYPSPNRKTAINSRRFYKKQKVFDFLAAVASFLLILFIANYQINDGISNNVQASFSGKKIKHKPTAEEVLTSLNSRNKSSLTRIEKRTLKKEFRKQLAVYLISKATGKTEDAEKAMLTILVIIGAVGLGVLLASLACSISCSGSDGLAILVAVGGLIGIIWLSVVLIQHINKKKDKTTNNGN